MLNIESLDCDKLGFFRYKRMRNNYLLTNEFGKYSFLEEQGFEDLVSGHTDRLPRDKYDELYNLGFINNRAALEQISKGFAVKNSFLGQGTSLHIIVITLRCDHRCVYCQASAQGLDKKIPDMDQTTAQHTVDRIFESSSDKITIEFQGGEPLINFKIFKFIVEYAKKKNKQAKKDLTFALVTNLSFMQENILEYLLEQDIAICTSLDGPENIHNRNRIIPGKKGGHKNVERWVKRIRSRYKEKGIKDKLGSLTTITRHSLGYPQAIIDEYLRLGSNCIPLRPLSPFGNSKESWSMIGYTVDEFIDFYRKAMDYIVELNLQGKFIIERIAQVFLYKILKCKDPGYLDIRSPCGAGIGQLAYYPNGDVYTCDEARMLASTGDDFFKLGNVKADSYRNFVSHPTTKAMCISSCLDNIPQCSSCVYNPYCGVCPVYNYFTSGNIFSEAPNNRICRLHTAILDYIFEKLGDQRVKKEVFERWLN